MGLPLQICLMLSPFRKNPVILIPAVLTVLNLLQCHSVDSSDEVPAGSVLTLTDLEAKFGKGMQKRTSFDEAFLISATDEIKQKAKLFADHYPSSNERRIDLFRSHLEGIGGAYVGVGTDQNFTFIAWARSPVAYLMDFDSVIVYVNRLHFLFLRESTDYATFKKYWSRANRRETAELIRQRLGNAPDYEQYLQAYEVAMRGFSGVPDRLQELEWMTAHFGFRSFHNDDGDYQFIRQMVLDGRIQAVLGDMNGETTFREISKSAERLNIPIRLVYLSNAEEYFRYPQSFRLTIQNLYTDDKGMIIRTVTSGAKEFGYPEGEKFVETHPFHYNLQNIKKMAVWMRDAPHPLWVYDMLKKRTDLQRGFSILHQDPYECGFLPLKTPVQQIRPSKAM